MIVRPGSLKVAVFYFAILMCINTGCDDDKNFEMGEDLVDIKSNLAIVDTFTLNISTVKTDSIQTSGDNIILVGKYSDGDFGTINSAAYVRVIPEAYSLLMDDESRYDSVSVFMHYTGYSYGDTTGINTIEVHQVLESLNKEGISKEWYNINQVKYAPQLLGQKTYRPRPQRKDRLTIRLSDTFGEEMFNLIYKESPVFYTEESFLKYFNGLALLPGSDNSSVIQFDTLQLNLYYHVGTEEKIFEFTTVMLNYYQFNQITGDYTLSPLSPLTGKNNRVPSNNTGNQSFCQAGTGLNMRVEIPSLRNLKGTASDIKIMNAQLILRPVKNTYNLIDLPTDLSLFTTNLENEKGSTFLTSDGYTLQPNLYIDELFNSETAYTFDITNYIVYTIQQSKDDDIPAFLVTIPDDDIQTSLKRVIFGNSSHQSNASELKIMYWYKN